ncbi:MAG: SPL family radical SAM protein [Desulfovibrio sp.]|uniref:SPL family radical SAM protein n=1 Tax=Desulfovibrio sp. 7SRBS1 TaxID=3378064 RepID=UPI003B3E9CCB
MRYIPAKTILGTVRNSPDCFFGGDYNINLYRGCPHACIYCDTLSDCYGIGDLSDIRAKENALEILNAEMGRKRRKGTVTTGSMNDPYMPLEKKLELTRGTLYLMAVHGFGVHVLTKSDLVVRDIDLLRKVGRVYAAVSLTITTADNELARILEPHAPSPERRLAAMRQLVSAGVYTGVTMMPVLPFLTDSANNLRDVLSRAADNGASYITFSPDMTLRDSCRKYYYEQLDTHFPGLAQRYMQTFGNSYVCPSPNAARLYDIFQTECARLGLATRIKAYSPPKDPKARQLTLFG